MLRHENIKETEKLINKTKGRKEKVQEYKKKKLVEVTIKMSGTNTINHPAYRRALCG